MTDLPPVLLAWWLVGYLLHHRAWEAAARQRARELRAMWERR